MIDLHIYKMELLELESKSKFEKMLRTSAILTEILMKHDIQPIIVGGLSVEIYTMNGYMTHDLDFVLNGYEQASAIFSELGFNKIGKDWTHPVLGISLEIPSNTLHGDYSKVTEVQVDGKSIYLIGLEDIILDRLRSAVHWQTGVDREWGYRLLLMYFEDLTLDYMYTQVTHPNEKSQLDEWVAQVRQERLKIDLI